MEVSNPRRVLAVSLEGSAHHLSRVVQDLTGSPPEPASTSFAGTTHNLAIKTQYYSATVPIWLDLIASSAEWAASFLADEAGEVLAVLGGLVLVFALPGSSSDSSPAPATAEQTRELIRQVGRVVKDGLGGWEWDGVALAVGIGEGDADEWDDLCAGLGMEFVQIAGSQQGKNEFGEYTGMARITEALEANDWAQLDSSALSDFGDFEDQSSDKPDDDAEFDPESLDFGYDKADFEGLRKAIWETSRDDQSGEAAKMDGSSLGDSLRRSTGESADEPTEGDKKQDGELDDEDVTKVEAMMRKLLAVREMGEGLSPEQRRRMAARAVQEVMKEL